MQPEQRKALEALVNDQWSGALTEFGRVLNLRARIPNFVHCGYHEAWSKMKLKPQNVTAKAWIHKMRKTDMSASKRGHGSL